MVSRCKVGHWSTRQQFSCVIVRHNYAPLAGLVVQWFVPIPVFIVSHLKCVAMDYCVLNLFVVPELYFLSFHYLHNRAEGLEYTFVCKVFKMYSAWLIGRWMVWILFRCWEPMILFVWMSINFFFFFFLSVIMVLSLHCILISILNCPVIFTHLRREICCIISGSFHIWLSR